MHEEFSLSVKISLVKYEQIRNSSIMEFFFENAQWFLDVNYIRKKLRVR